MVRGNTISLIKTVTEFTEIRNSLSAGVLMMCKDVKLQQGQRQCKKGGRGDWDMRKMGTSDWLLLKSKRRRP